MRSEVTSLSNWANDKSTLSVSRPIEVVVLNCWVTETNETPWASNSSIISRPNQGPPGMGLTLYISRGCVVLGIERIELLIQSVIGRDPGVDRAADGFEARSLHDRASAGARSSLSLSPKKRGPFHFVPVIAKATLERLS